MPCKYSAWQGTSKYKGKKLPSLQAPKVFPPFLVKDFATTFSTTCYDGAGDSVGNSETIGLQLFFTKGFFHGYFFNNKQDTSSSIFFYVMCEVVPLLLQVYFTCFKLFLDSCLSITLSSLLHSCIWAFKLLQAQALQSSCGHSYGCEWRRDLWLRFLQVPSMVFMGFENHEYCTHDWSSAKSNLQKV
jgi:hypothetical protein